MVIYLLSWSPPIVYGPLADKIGRKPPLIIGLALIALGSLLCAVSTNMPMLITARVIQGLGGGACVLWRSIFRDSFQGDELAKMGSYLGTLIIFIVPAAPLLGGIFQTTWGWRSSFIFMCIYGIASLFITLFVLEETHDRTQQTSLPVFTTLRNPHIPPLMQASPSA